MFILDTDVLSNLRKEKKDPRVRSWVEQIGWPELSTTVITVTELKCGIERQLPQHPDYARRTQAWLDALLDVGGPRIYVLSVRAALILATMHETPALRNFVVPDRRQKTPKTAADLAIAAIALAEGAVVATGNASHFVEISACFTLPGVYNPFKDQWVVTPSEAGHASL